MNNAPNGGSAFPLPLGTANMSEPSESCGMTLRDYFAAKAMQGFAASDAEWSDGVIGMARCAYAWADAMLATGSRQ